MFSKIKEDCFERKEKEKEKRKEARYLRMAANMAVRTADEKRLAGLSESARRANMTEAEKEKEIYSYVSLPSKRALSHALKDIEEYNLIPEKNRGELIGVTGELYVYKGQIVLSIYSTDDCGIKWLKVNSLLQWKQDTLYSKKNKYLFGCYLSKIEAGFPEDPIKAIRDFEGYVILEADPCAEDERFLPKGPVKVDYDEVSKATKGFKSIQDYLKQVLVNQARILAHLE